MTSAYQERPRSVWLAHHQPIIYLAFAACVTVECFVHSQIVGWLFTPVTLLTMATEVGVVRHKAVLCERCIAEFPLDGAERAARNPWQLEHFHRFKLRMVLSLLMLGAVLCASFTGIKWITLFVWLYLCAEAWAVGTHRKLEPWCRRCRGGGWDDDETPVPPPVPTVEGLL